MGLILESPDARRVCTLSGVQDKLFAEKLITFRDLEATLTVAIREAAQAEEDESFGRRMELSFKLVQVICDLVIAGLEDAAGPGGKAVSTIYDSANRVVAAFNGESMVGQALLASTNAKVDAVGYQLTITGNGKYAKALSHTKTLVNLVHDLHGYWNSGGRAAVTGGSGIASARRTAQGQLLRIQRQIRVLEEELERCS